jgi:uncharacterized membrane protein
MYTILIVCVGSAPLPATLSTTTYDLLTTASQVSRAASVRDQANLQAVTEQQHDLQRIPSKKGSQFNLH